MIMDQLLRFTIGVLERGKLLYLLPIIGPLWFGLRDSLAARSKKSEYRTALDLKNNTVAAVDWSLPVETRQKLR